MKDLFSKPAALISVAICAAQPVFYAMSGVIMPEMLLTLFTILATWALLKKKWGHYMLAASLAILTKESGLTVLPAAVLFLFIESLRERDFFTVHRWKYFLAAAAPVLVFGLFLLVQKAQNGWYFFPLHIGYINYSWSNIRANIPRIFDDIFLMQGRRLAGLMFLLWCILTVVFSKKARAAYNAMLLFTLMIFCAMCFSSINFYLVRYLVYVVPFVAAGAAALMVWGAAHLPKPVRLPAVAVLTAGIVFLGYLNIDPKQFGDTSDMSYRHLVLNEQEAIRWAEVQPWRADTAVGANFPVFQALQDKRNGYLTGPPWPYSENCEMLTSHAILSHLDGNIPAPANRPYRVIRQFNREYSHITILEFQQP